MDICSLYLYGTYIGTHRNTKHDACKRVKRRKEEFGPVIVLLAKTALTFKKRLLGPLEGSAHK